MYKIEFYLTLLLFLMGMSASLLGISFQHPWIGPLFVITFSITYLLTSKRALETTKLSLVILIITYTLTALFTLFGLFHFRPTDISFGQVPIWYSSICLIFAVTFPVLFSQMKNMITASMTGLIVTVPFMFLLTKLSLIQLQYNEYISLFIIALPYAILFPILLKLRNHLLQTQAPIKANH